MAIIVVLKNNRIGSVSMMSCTNNGTDANRLSSVLSRALNIGTHTNYNIIHHLVPAVYTCGQNGEYP